MKVQLLRSKIHGIKVTSVEIDYEGSLSLDRELMEAAGLLPYERVEVYNIMTGERFSTYLIPEKRGSRVCILNGAAARKGSKGDRLIIAAYAILDEEKARDFSPKILVLDQKNEIGKRIDPTRG